MTRRDVRLRAGWFGYRKLDVHNCIEHLIALSDAELRTARQAQQGLEAAMAQTQQENHALRQDLARRAAAQAVSAAQADGLRQQLEALARRLAAAQARIRRYQTRLFAYERAMIALRRENAELQARCAQPPVPAPQEPPAAVQAAPPVPCAKAAPAVHAAPQPAPQPAPWAPSTELERLSVELMDQMARLMAD